MLMGNNIKYKNAVTFLDVGQGDGIYLESEDGMCYMVDGGSSSEKELGEYTLLPFLRYHGRGHVDLWFISHLDEDHISGLKDLLRTGYSVERICLMDTMRKEKGVAELQRLARQNGTVVTFLKGGSRLKAGTLKFFLWGEKSEELNDESMVLLVQYAKTKKNFLFAGDISFSMEEVMLPKIQRVAGGDGIYVLKANHHGSDYSNSALWLQGLQPKYIVVSCGIKNNYGHPGRQAIMRMRIKGCKIGYTMRTGQIGFSL